ncbi:MAG: S26 family signal peptidase, partial [Saprospiraceae bacterium]|nr:S26 family signal peptidase [Saprospiraceae bacterium]
MAVTIFSIIYILLWGITIKPLFEKAGIEGWKAYVPGLNFFEAGKMVGHKPSWALWLLFPIVNFFFLASLNVDLVRSFGKYSFLDSALAVIFAPIPFFQIGQDEG